MSPRVANMVDTLRDQHILHSDDATPPAYRCTCGWASGQRDRPRAEHLHEQHLFERFEILVRSGVAVEILAVRDNPDALRPRDPEGKFSTDLANDFTWAAMIALEVPR